MYAIPLESRRGCWTGPGVPDGCEPLCGFQDSNLGPLKEQPGLLAAAPSLQPPNLFTVTVIATFHFKNENSMGKMIKNTKYKAGQLHVKEEPRSVLRVK